jgi:outer membrane protein OmpA-like peptidoglycan-associated protein
MIKGLLPTIAILFVFWANSTLGDEVLVFPKTEAEIVDVLKNPEGRPIYVIGGKTIYVIEVKRTQEEDPELDNAPKAGALIHFDFDSAQIRPESHALLDEFGKALKGGLADASFVIAGHTDSRGTNQYNMKLSEQRANAVKDYLVSNHSVDSKRLSVKAYGEGKPIASNDTQEDRQLNRRVEFIRVVEPRQE